MFFKRNKKFNTLNTYSCPESCSGDSCWGCETSCTVETCDCSFNSSIPTSDIAFDNSNDNNASTIKSTNVETTKANHQDIFEHNDSK